MTTVLAHRKYRLASRLAYDTARTFGLYAVVAFAALLAASVVWREITGEYESFAQLVLFAVPLIVIVIAWVHLSKSYPLGIAGGLTRREFLTAYALFGLATVLVTAGLTQLGLMVDGRFAAARGAEPGMGFYGLAALEAVVRPALYFACGAAAAAAKLRFRSTRIGVALSALIVVAVVYRQVAYYAVMKALGMENGSADGSVFEYPLVDLSAIHPYLDLVLAVAFTLTAWALLARAPMPPKRA
ncbi:hypothetical protein K3N28_15205 [Glycomyces sp. TRM65418]|uniref:hypothetical protein n=1 Tax=Glycomyces sp. TRM65418 TaxID=2867006 RepID=UPI001CE5DB3D|nr:hypothetical protein [Glycomyces sp. TRM65418]MCC3764413.1 hypothetical protein [Glycomyces sp. TRM65418]QZD54089.1 hypothetical protein K3N28_15130 [Glycomyces sp. TRM65418]